MKTYKILSIAFVIACAALLVMVLLAQDYPDGKKLVLALCLGAVMAAMLFNLSVIRKKEKQQE